MNASVGAWIYGRDINIADETITDGRGHSLTDRRGLFVVHAVLLHTGKVLWFCGHVEDGHYALKSYLFNYRHPADRLPSQVFPLHNPNLARGGILHAPASTETHADLFCCHFVHAPDGKVIVVGGSDPDFHVPGGGSRDSVGEPYIYAFNPNSETWQVVQTASAISRLAQGRWYPTAVALGDGRIAVFSGRREYDGGTGRAGPTSVAQIVEVLAPGRSGTYTDYSASTLTDSASTATPRPDLRLALPIYPGLHLAPNGRIYYTHTTWGLEFPTPANTQSIEILPGATSATWTDHGGTRPTRPTQPRREEGMSVLLPPAHHGKILLFGGSEARTRIDPRLRNAAALDPGPQAQPGGGWPVLPNGGTSRFTHVADPADARSSEILDTAGARPSWSRGPRLRQARINGHAVILPDKKVLIFGGHDGYKWRSRGDVPPTIPSLESELYDPGTNTTRRMAELQNPRMYHSAAVLLPDGTVLVAGGADPNEEELDMHRLPPRNFAYPPGWEGPRMPADTAYNRKDFEIFRPTYLSTPGPQPVIDAVRRNGAATTQAEYGTAIVVTSRQAARITDVAFMRPGAATHHTDTEQRYVELRFTRSGNDLTVTMPTNRNLAPPGYYMLWIVANGKPCVEAKFIQLTEPAPVRPGAPRRGP